MDTQERRLGYSADEVADLFGISRQHVYNLHARGMLDSFTLGRTRRFTHESVMRLAKGEPFKANAS
jgi:excisionase family DNA binding protein